MQKIKKIQKLFSKKICDFHTIPKIKKHVQISKQRNLLGNKKVEFTNKSQKKN